MTTDPPDGLRQQDFEARVHALGQFAAYLMRRLGAPEALVVEWRRAWNHGDLTRLCAWQTEIERALKPPPRKD